jgi:hypothetical protein
MGGATYRALTQSFLGFGFGGTDIAAAVKKIAEVIVYNRELTANERSYVRKQYLGPRYNITVT